MVKKKHADAQRSKKTNTNRCGVDDSVCMEAERDGVAVVDAKVTEEEDCET